MAVNINNATFGYDANNLQQAINNLNIKCVSNTVASINSGLMTLRGAVDESWKGQSAEKFKAKMEEDANEVTKAIEEVGNDVITALQGFVGSLGEVDNSITF